MRYAALVLIVLAGCNARQPAPPAPQPVPEASTQEVDADLPVLMAPPVTVSYHKRARNVLIVGDSEACAVSYYVKETVKALNDAAQEPRDSVDVVCKGGTVVQYWGGGGHFREALSSHPKTDSVLVFLGTNHYGSTATPPVKPMLDLVTDHKLDCLWVGNTAVKGKHWPINDIMRDAVSPTCSYFDSEAASISLADGVHPTKEGAIRWIKLVWPLIPPKYNATIE